MKLSGVIVTYKMTLEAAPNIALPEPSDVTNTLIKDSDTNGYNWDQVTVVESKHQSTVSFLYLLITCKSEHR